jgi:hypothetical protein
VSSLRITKRNLFLHRCTRVSFLLSFAILQQISHSEFLSWYEIKYF